MAEIKKVFCAEPSNTDRPEPFSENPHPMITCLSISRPPWPVFSFKINMREWKQISCKLERSCFHTEWPSESLSLSLPLSLIYPIVISPVFHRTLGLLYHCHQLFLPQIPKQISWKKWSKSCKLCTLTSMIIIISYLIHMGRQQTLCFTM